MKQTIFLALLLAIFGSWLQAQSPKTEKKRYYQIAISNSHSAKPFGSFSSLFYEDFHPGLDIGYSSVFRNANKHQWFLEMRLSYMYHRWVQHNIALLANAGYRYKITSTFSADIRLGGGYQLSIPDSKVFRITASDGLQKKNNTGRSQLIGNLGLGFSKKISNSGSRVFIEYQQRIQTPFIKEYVPILPYNNMLVGFAFPIH